jgi:hypothetical protein
LLLPLLSHGRLLEDFATFALWRNLRAQMAGRASYGSGEQAERISPSMHQVNNGLPQAVNQFRGSLSGMQSVSIDSAFLLRKRDLALLSAVPGAAGDRLKSVDIS